MIGQTSHLPIVHFHEPANVVNTFCIERLPAMQPQYIWIALYFKKLIMFAQHSTENETVQRDNAD
jgi:hypothetical protein